MRKAFRHTGVLMMAAVAALGLLGAAYTLWFEDLELHAEVETGTFDIDWSIEGDGAHPIVSTDFGTTFGQFPEGKPPTGCDIGIGPSDIPGNPGNGVGTEDLNVMKLYLLGLYPYAGCEFWIDVHNDGTVPAHVTFADLQLNGSPDLLNALRWGIDGQRSDPRCGDLLINSVIFGERHEIPGIQLHAGEKIICHFRVWLAQEDVEDQKAEIWITWRWHQWNEQIAPLP